MILEPSHFHSYNWFPIWFVVFLSLSINVEKMEIFLFEFFVLNNLPLYCQPSVFEWVLVCVIQQKKEPIWAWGVFMPSCIFSFLFVVLWKLSFPWNECDLFYSSSAYDFLWQFIDRKKNDFLWQLTKAVGVVWKLITKEGKSSNICMFVVHVWVKGILSWSSRVVLLIRIFI